MEWSTEDRSKYIRYLTQAAEHNRFDLTQFAHAMVYASVQPLNCMDLTFVEATQVWFSFCRSRTNDEIASRPQMRSEVIDAAVALLRSALRRPTLSTADLEMLSELSSIEEPILVNQPPTNSMHSAAPSVSNNISSTEVNAQRSWFGGVFGRPEERRVVEDGL
jgi:hypothetical protein